ncbi:MAG: hypothetical protein ABIP39_04310 [Polyangiaceae bacterium]
MHEQDLAIIKALIPMAWADGVYADKEKETIDALLEAFDADAADKERIHLYANEKRTLDDIDLQELSAPDRRLVIQHAVLLSFVDGSQGPEELELLANLVTKLKVPADEAKEIIEAATVRAKKNLNLL